MCDRDGCSVFSENFQTLLNPAFTFVVQCAGGLIKDQDRRIFQEHAGDLEIDSVDKVPLLIDRLHKEGFTSSELDKLTYDNMYRVIRDTMK